VEGENGGRRQRAGAWNDLREERTACEKSGREMTSLRTEEEGTE